jgi:hypothetical protein
MGRKELEDQLRELRKAEGAKPISKMKAVDISAEIERLKNRVETVPASRQNPERATPHRDSAVESIQEAREKEFPVRPVKVKAEKKSVAPKKAAPAAKSSVSKAQLMKMLSEVSDDE